jgi:glycosyltransferase involved in cell wall biosynthesis
MRVLQVITDDDRRGAQVFALDLQRGLAASGCAVETYALAPGRVGGLDVPLLGRRPRAPATIRALRGKARGVDVVVAHGSTTLPVSAIALSGLRCPFVYRQISDSLFWADTPLRRARVRAAMSKARLIVALWGGAARTLVDDLGVAASKVRIIPNGVVGDDWLLPAAEARYAARRALGLDKDLRVVAYVGAMVSEKAPELAVEAVAGLPGVHLLLAGAGPEETAVRALAGVLLPGRATLVGSSAHVSSVYAASDVLLFPSRAGDSMPAVVIEAGLAGLPTLATSVGALVAMIDPGVTGGLVERPDAGLLCTELRRMLADIDATRAMGRAARVSFLARYEMSIVAKQWHDVLDEAAGL